MTHSDSRSGRESVHRGLSAIAQFVDQELRCKKTLSQPTGSGDLTYSMVANDDPARTTLTMHLDSGVHIGVSAIQRVTQCEGVGCHSAIVAFPLPFAP